MAFRDESVAARSRVEALEGEVARLAAENEALRGAAIAPQTPVATRGAAAVAVGIAVALGVAAWYAGFVVSGYVGEQTGIALGVAAVVSLFAAVALVLVAQLLVVVPPNRVAVIIGRQHRGPDGTSRGFRIVTGGRAMRAPLVETVATLPDGPFAVDLVLRAVFVRRPEGARADIHLRALISYPRDERRLENAIEHFLGADREVVTKVARETLEGTLRNVAAELTVEELREDREKVAHHIQALAEETLDKLGLRIDTLHVLDVDSSDV